MATSVSKMVFASGPVRQDNLSYMPGFGGHFCSEALPNALPEGQNGPQRCPYDLYAEQLSGTAFTVPRAGNQRSWLYRIRPAVCHEPLQPMESGKIRASFTETSTDAIVLPNQIRWLPLPLPSEGERVDFVKGVYTMAGAGSPETKNGLAIHMYSCNASMVDSAYVNCDGDFLFVHQHGTMTIKTEFGVMSVKPGEIAVVQRGIRFAVLCDEPVRGYICEIFKSHFKLPDLGPIGANGLANPRDFLTPVAAYEDVECDFTIYHKFLGKMFYAKSDHSCFDVVAWHGNYAPYKYDLAKFNCINSVTYDHPDPSIYTVLTCPTDEPGVAICDFVIFPPRWMVMEHSFRPPYYHRNLMSEFMGNIRGVYDAKEDGFLPGGASLHSCMIPHGPEAAVFEKAIKEPMVPRKIPDDSLAFMFESTMVFKLTEFAAHAPHIDKNYHECWRGLRKLFNPNKQNPWSE